MVSWLNHNVAGRFGLSERSILLISLQRTSPYSSTEYIGSMGNQQPALAAFDNPHHSKTVRTSPGMNQQREFFLKKGIIFILIPSGLLIPVSEMQIAQNIKEVLAKLLII
jgi:hypothetical protein